MHHELVDTTEMYLRTILELEEEGEPALRARIVERLGQTPPTVSQTVGRLERDGLVVLTGDRHLDLTPAGREIATRVMRRHRLAECLLVGIIGLDWELVHAESCRWEHVMSEAVERRLLEVLGHPTVSPFGNPIPGLDEFGEPAPATGPQPAAVPLAELPAGVSTVVARRIDEAVQTDSRLMSHLRRAGFQPGALVSVARTPNGVMVGTGAEATEVSRELAAHLLASPVGEPALAETGAEH